MKKRAKSADSEPVLEKSTDIPPFQGEGIVPFPEQLYQLLHNPSLKEHVQDAIYWLPDHPNIFVLQEQRFSEKLLESHFRGKSPDLSQVGVMCMYSILKQLLTELTVT
jgi:hypothetical protein